MERLNRYYAKIRFINEKIERLPTNFSDEFMLDALYYRLQSAIEAITDIISMLCKDIGVLVEDDYVNIENLANKKVISKTQEVNLKRLNGLRNVIVHQYNGIQEEIILESLESIITHIMEFTKYVKTNIQSIIN